MRREELPFRANVPDDQQSIRACVALRACLRERTEPTTATASRGAEGVLEIE